MADFDDSLDPELGAACNRLAAFREGLMDIPNSLIDIPSRLTAADLDAVLVKLYRTRKLNMIPVLSDEEMKKRFGSKDAER